MKEQLKEKFIQNLIKGRGIICYACANTGINRSTYYRWRETDGEFAEAVDEVMETQIDYVENKLLNLVDSNDTTATIFYLKTKGKKRGWNEKQQPIVSINGGPGPAAPALPDDGTKKPAKESVSTKIRSKKAYIKNLLKKQGKYTTELSYQVTITAQLLVRTEMLAEEVMAEGHEAINVEVSREGNERRSISPKEKLYLDYAEQSQKALKALGMNTDSKERKTDNDTFSEFLKEFSDESDDDKE